MKPEKSPKGGIAERVPSEVQRCQQCERSELTWRSGHRQAVCMYQRDTALSCSSSVSLKNFKEKKLRHTLNTGNPMKSKAILLLKKKNCR